MIGAVLAVAALSAQEPVKSGAVFRADVRLVEVHAAVFDSRGNYVKGLKRHEFRLLDNGAPVEPTVFESSSSSLSCAILLDTTGSMADDLPAVKNSVNRLIERLQAQDSVAVFGFASSLRTLQPFTTEKDAARNAVLQANAVGQTALFDAIAQTARELEKRQGRKALIVFTDGNDNASLLNPYAASRRAKRAGVPIYAIVFGEALRSSRLRDQLAELSRITGGQTYEARTRKKVEEAFADISKDLEHTYLLAYPPPQPDDPQWRTIQVQVPGGKAFRVRAKEGYFSD